MSFDLCQIRKASKPYYIENISTSIYSIEELCFYLYHNPCLIDRSLMNEYLCDWLRDELGLTRLYRQLYEALDQEKGTAAFVLPIFREAGYLNTRQMHEYQSQLQQLEVQPQEMKEKLKADYLVRCGMYPAAIRQYRKLLDHQIPGNNDDFYAQLWNNLGCAWAREFKFREASGCFLNAWELSKTKETLRKYVSTLPLYLSPDEYRNKMKELGAEEELLGKIQEYNASVAREAEKESDRDIVGRTPQKQLEEIREEYRRRSGV